MPSIKCAGNSCLDTGTEQTLCAASLPSCTDRHIGRLFAVVLTAAALGACAQSNVTSNKTEFRTASRPPSLENNRTASRVTHRRVAVALRRHTPFAKDSHAPETRVASYGVASFYSEEQETANGETFDPNKLTAAHPTLPFGTRLRVTNVSTGRSVTVRVNDRGPYVPGRIVDVSYSAAQTLGIVDRGIAKVKLDVVQ
jgi:rare lipoprotein A